jgi:sec-independent protein translocase protein TatC
MKRYQHEGRDMIEADQTPETNQKLPEMSFLDHLTELRKRLFYSILAIVVTGLGCFIYAKEMIDFLIHPALMLNPPIHLQVLKVQGMFIVQVLVAFVGGLVLSIPILVYQIWAFVKPGLYRKERKWVGLLIVFTFFCFIAGAAIAYYLMLPLALRFFMNISQPYSVSPIIAIDYYIRFVVMLMLSVGVVFELPVLSFILTKMGILHADFMKKSRKYALIVIFILAAILTPPDPFTQLLMAVPLIFVYEISITIVRFSEKSST